MEQVFRLDASQAFRDAGLAGDFTGVVRALREGADPWAEGECDTVAFALLERAGESQDSWEALRAWASAADALTPKERGRMRDLVEAVKWICQAEQHPPATWDGLFPFPNSVLDDQLWSASLPLARRYPSLAHAPLQGKFTLQTAAIQFTWPDMALMLLELNGGLKSWKEGDRETRNAMARCMTKFLRGLRRRLPHPMIDFQEQDENGDTLLHLVVRYPEEPHAQSQSAGENFGAAQMAIELAMDHGARLDIPNNHGDTVLTMIEAKRWAKPEQTGEVLDRWRTVVHQETLAAQIKGSAEPGRRL